MTTDRPTLDGQLDALADVAAALARGTDLDATLAVILGWIARSAGAAESVLFLRDPDLPDLQLAATVGLGEDERTRLAAAVATGEHPIAAAARDVTAVFGRSVGGGGAPGPAGVAADIPLAVARNGLDLPLGVVSFMWPPSFVVDEPTERLVRAGADLLAVAVDRSLLATLVAERAEWFERMAHTDPLTGLANRRTFERILELEVARAGRQGGEVSIALLDIDGFSDLNAVAGHEIGDDVLRTIAAVLAELVRLVDTVARYGGDEFVLIAPGSAGMTVARRVIDGIAAIEPVHGQRPSASAGVARFPVDGTTAEELIGAAEAALAAARSGAPGSIATAGVSPD